MEPDALFLLIVKDVFLNRLPCVVQAALDRVLRCAQHLSDFLHAHFVIIIKQDAVPLRLWERIDDSSYHPGGLGIVKGLLRHGRPVPALDSVKDAVPFPVLKDWQVGVSAGKGVLTAVCGQTSEPSPERRRFL